VNIYSCIKHQECSVILLRLELLLFQLELDHKSLSVVVNITDYMTPQNVTDVTTSSFEYDLTPT